jgi:hypothetical protein
MNMVAPEATAKEWPLELNDKAVAFDRLTDPLSMKAFLQDTCLRSHENKPYIFGLDGLLPTAVTREQYFAP